MFLDKVASKIEITLLVRLLFVAGARRPQLSIIQEITVNCDTRLKFSLP